MPRGTDENPEDGAITEAMRRKLREKRVELGLPLKSVGAVLGVNLSTVRKWERGLTRSCSITVRPRLQRFLDGEYDRMFEARPGIPPMPALGDASRKTAGAPGESLQAVLQGVSALYDLCADRPELREELLGEIKGVTFATLAKLGLKG